MSDVFQKTTEAINEMDGDEITHLVYVSDLGATHYSCKARDADECEGLASTILSHSFMGKDPSAHQRKLEELATNIKAPTRIQWERKEETK